MSTIKTDGIVVLGPFRSGTSLACRILSGLGVVFGPEEAMLGIVPALLLTVLGALLARRGRGSAPRQS